MARARVTKKEAQAQPETLKIESFDVLRANEYEATGTIFADLKINGLTVYGCTIVKRKDGSGEFISFPSRKGSDGKYYSIVYARLSDMDSDAIIDAVYNLLD